MQFDIPIPPFRAKNKKKHVTIWRLSLFVILLQPQFISWEEMNPEMVFEGLVVKKWEV